MNFAGTLPVFIVINLLTVCVKCEFSAMSVLSSGFNKVSKIIQSVECNFVECCTTEYISSDIDKLDDILNKELFGQEIAHRVIINALYGHLTSSNPPKALTMSFHGPPGTGKTYISQLIAKVLYKNGDQSKFYHFFNGRNDFPLQEKVNEYKEELYTIIINSLQKCERSMFVFDEVDKMPEGSSRITQRLLTLWGEGKQRRTTKLQDFENLISIGAFNEKGGFYHSDTIDSSVIDHYVPFLPLEEVHVKKCLEKAFLNRGVHPTNDMIEEGLSYVVFGPPPHNIYATKGCKRLEQKVAAIVYANKKTKIEF
ncbi:torsin-1A-like isoform X2 [Bombus vosnesenskii]|uniref:Torsin-1A-like isoform X2 n=1 Tax=Bombus vosnesenskii TaxID=207650 RepID=A0A6J3KB05_9HYME|nr:torsin-1A-like isoform X2 [Bombus vosnesenskii]XP_050472047.1 torsin-1A-like isoform X2 [Bombus huntii]